MSKYHPFLWRHIEPGEEFFLCFVPELIGKEGNIEALIVVWSLSYLIIVVESNLRKYEKVEIHPQMSSTPKERGISLLKFLFLWGWKTGLEPATFRTTI
ncbi:hypothetical protein [Bacteroides nordii]|uniref:hypothetical protein n=1 Tax=Bacteroides nordii TaxID=291645 RepID=UPI002A82B6AE|nr:hypothetical protein [Bacteroides nordii]